MTLDDFHLRLGWPRRQQVLHPPDAAALIRAGLARDKVGFALSESLKEHHGNDGIRCAVGVLAGDTGAGDSTAPSAIVCEFTKPVSDAVLAEAHRLAWNFCRMPLLFTIDPTCLRAFTCCEQPAQRGAATPKGELENLRISAQGPSLKDAEDALSWPSLVAGDLLRRSPERFRRGGCADAMLLQNLSFVREQLTKAGLATDTSHDLLARLIFIQFLFDRKDSEGRSALNAEFLNRLHRDGDFRRAHTDLASVLTAKTDAYGLFKILDNRFNGDLFPTDADATSEQRERQWQAEMDQVSDDHLVLLGKFVGGTLEMPKKQHTLWRLYSFDVIPLEFISSIYEEFVNRDRIERDQRDQAGGNATPVSPGTQRRAIAPHYTPGHVVDLVLDTVLPWDCKEWDLRVLDPACGSGAFLVSVFRRLVHRWRLAHPGQTPRAADLRSLLERNLFGVDMDPHAVRVASFSLYLAMCDEIDPKYYWQQVKFPPLRGRNIWQSDFFDDSVKGFRTYPDAKSYHLIIGNAPWGYDSLTPLGATWGRLNDWHPANKNEGPLFLAKAMHLLRDNGRMAMIQPAELLFNSTETFAALRCKIFQRFIVEEVINLSALRFGTFKDAVGPACVFVISPGIPEDQTVLYSSPKPSRSPEDDFRVVIGPDDVHEVLLDEARSDPVVWTALMWGGRRDYGLVRRLRGMGRLSTLLAAPGVHARSGIKSNRPHRNDAGLLGRQLFIGAEFPASGKLTLNPQDFVTMRSTEVYKRDSTDYRAFEPVQMLLKLGWQAKGGRFAARLVDALADGHGALCSRSYFSISVPKEQRAKLKSACIFLNSKVAAYYLLLTSGRFAMYRPEPTTAEFLQVPLIDLGNFDIRKAVDVADLDRVVADVLKLRAAERILVDDTFDYTLPEFKGGSKADRDRFYSAPTRSTLQAYADRFSIILRSGFGRGAAVAATIYLPPTGQHLAVNLVRFSLNGAEHAPATVEIDSRGLLAHLAQIAKIVAPADEAPVIRQRVLRVYRDAGAEKPEVQVYIVKPSQVRYWTRSSAMKDADAVAADIMMAARAEDDELKRTGEQVA